MLLGDFSVFINITLYLVKIVFASCFSDCVTVVFPGKP